jgi:transcription elongation GreA/GreB family factor
VARLETLLPGLTDEAEAAAAKRDLRYWRTRLATAQPMPTPDGAAVAFGCTVHFRLNGTERAITVVGDDEAEPTHGLIAFSAPLSRAMMEAEVGDILSFAGKADAIEILKIEGAPG